MFKLMAALSLAILAALGTQTAFGQQNPPGCFPASDVGVAIFCVQGGVTNAIVGQTVVVGETVLYQARVFQNSDSDCSFEGGHIDITTPDGVTTNATLGKTIPLICGSPGCNPVGTNVFFSDFVAYTVRSQDIGVQQANVAPCNPSMAGRIQAKAVYTGGISHCDANNSCDPTATISACNPVVIRGLSATKLVACTTGSVCDASLAYSSTADGAKFGQTNPKFCYSITITNTGTAALLITNVNDNVLGDLTASFPAGLGPNSGATVFIGPTTESVTTTNTVTVLGKEVVSCQQLPVNASASASVTVIATPISCEVRFIQNSALLTGNAGSCNSCGADVGILPSGNQVTVVVRVTNTAGNGQNIVNGVVNVGTSSFNVGGPIAPGASADVTVDTIAGNALGCHSYAADVTFQGALSDSCPPITTSCSKSLEICGTPKVRIVKLVKCVTDSNPEGECETGNCSTDLSLYAPSATGVIDAGFCYGIVIENNGELTLTNVVVNDNQLGSPLAGFPSTLVPGQSATNFYQKFYSNPGTVRNTATVTGQSSSGEISANTNAVVTLLQPSISCQKTVSLNGGPFNSGGTVEIQTGSSNDVTFAVTVNNNGDVDLQNVQVIDTGTSGCPASTNTIDFLAVGASTNIVLCTITGVTCPPETTIHNVVNVSAEVSTNVCSIDLGNCQRVKTSSSCNNTITLTCIQPVACRTTGGGKQFNVCQSSAIPTPVPQYVTHGGQVGAPFAVATTCILNTPCIRGEWTHVRHISPKLDGNFHAASNGKIHQFDSLQCACLPCTDLATVVPAPSPVGAVGTCLNVDLNYTNTLALVDGKRFALCNPDQPKNGCGPEPRPAPDNKICFSGLGNYALKNGRRAQSSVVFRVDIEDRSEPGGSFPGGGAPPPDRYRFRMWLTTGMTQSEIDTLRCQVACRDPLIETVCAPAPDVDDGGALDRGNRQIHPSTSAKPPASCGTEQPNPCTVD